MPLGLTRLEARTRATVAAFLVKRPLGGKVETVLTACTHFLPARAGRCARGECRAVVLLRMTGGAGKRHATHARHASFPTGAKSGHARGSERRSQVRRAASDRVGPVAWVRPLPCHV